jgi:hypothetical protein
MGFGGLLQLPNTPFGGYCCLSARFLRDLFSGLIETGGDPHLAYLLYNGRLGLFPDPLNETAASQHFLSQMYQSGQLLNPVVGMRFDPMNPKITIGALDPSDYQGQINWVPLTSPNSTWTYKNTFMIDGLKGYNGSFLPGSENLLAVLDSCMVDPYHLAPTSYNVCFSVDWNLDAQCRYLRQKYGLCRKCALLPQLQDRSCIVCVQLNCPALRSSDGHYQWCRLPNGFF